MRNDLVARLLSSAEPSIRYKMLTRVLGQPEDSPEASLARQQVRSSRLASSLLSQRDPDGRTKRHTYQKWAGAHWVLASLADNFYPRGDESLLPMREQEYEWLLAPEHLKKRVRVIEGRVRRCASQEANCVYSLLVLGIDDERTDELVQRLLAWQWPDGGWNCDRRPEAHNSSFMETLIPLRALALYARVREDDRARAAVERAAEVFLKRRLFRRQSDGSVIMEEFTRLHYPCYWHYDILSGLKVMAEAGLVKDPRCSEALDLLESKRLPDGGFPATGRYFVVRDLTPDGRATTGTDLYDWGSQSARKMNEFVTVDALYVLREAGR